MDLSSDEVSMDLLSDETFMRLALLEAAHAEALGEVPVGAICVKDGVVVGRGFNLRERSQDPTAHAEHLAVRQAAAQLGSWRLEGVTCYVTLEPCAMCAGTLVNARVERVVWGADDPKAGAVRSLYTLGTDGKLNHTFEAVGGVLGEECGAQLTAFFQRIRAAKKASERR
jgi:tRNA(adenine34) deaminase